jgi:hypothetical protein
MVTVPAIRVKCKSSSCPICRSMFLNVRNHTLEKIMSKVTVSCKYSPFGCNLVLPMDDISAHEIICPQWPYRCPITGCAWSCPFVTLHNHLRITHGAFVLENTGKGITSLKHFITNNSWQSILLFNEAIFLHASKVRASTLYTCVLHAGPENKTSGFRYSVESSQADDNAQASANHVV